jgi:hypothetical protein
MPKKVFVSYAQVPEAHKLRVAELVASLQAAGLSVLFDQDVTSPQGPPEGWPQWMLNQIEQADWVLVVCNEVYYRRFRGREEPGRGLGARWEGAIIGQALYNDGMLNRKFIPVLFGDETTAHIPEPLQGATYYRLPADLPKLTSALTGNSSAKPAASITYPARATTATDPRRERLRSASWLAALAVLVLMGFLLWQTNLLEKLGLNRPPASNFTLTVYVHGQAGLQDLILRSQGAVLLDLGSDRRREPIRDKGQAFFPEIPASFRGQAVNVGLDANGYELADPWPKRSLKNTSLYLSVRKKPGVFKGHVQDEQGRPVVGASITVADLTTIANEHGNFELTVPPERLQDELPLLVLAKGYSPWNGTAVHGSNEIAVTLTRKP